MGIQWIPKGFQLWILRVPNGSLGFINFPARGLVVKIMQSLAHVWIFPTKKQIFMFREIYFGLLSIEGATAPHSLFTYIAFAGGDL